MIVLKHVEYEIRDADELENLLNHVNQTISRVDGVEFKEINFPRDKKEFVLALDCTDENRYLAWRSICPPPNGAKDWYEILLSSEEFLKRQV